MSIIIEPICPPVSDPGVLLPTKCPIPGSPSDSPSLLMMGEEICGRLSYCLHALLQRTAVVSEMCVFCHLADANHNQYGPFRGARQTLAHEEKNQAQCQCVKGSLIVVALGVSQPMSKRLGQFSVIKKKKRCSFSAEQPSKPSHSFPQKTEALSPLKRRC